MINVITWKWKQPPNPPRNKRKPCEFSAKHVNVLYSMVSRHLHMPFNFICLTDDPHGINPNIQTIPIWRNYLNTHGCYVRLKAFSNEAKDLLGPKFVSFDLDCVIVNDITPLFDRDEDFMIWEDSEKRRTPYCCSLWMHKPGTHTHVWKDFHLNTTMNKVKKAGFVTGTDQAYLSYKFYPNAATWVKDDGIYNFKIHIMKKYQTITTNKFKRTIFYKKKSIFDKKLKKETILINDGSLPENTKIVFFNGVDVDPSIPYLQENYPWIKENWW